MSLRSKLGDFGALVTSRRGEKIAAAICTLLGLVLVASPFTILSGLRSGLVLVTFLLGGFFLVLARYSRRSGRRPGTRSGIKRKQTHSVSPSTEQGTAPPTPSGIFR